MSTLRDTAYRLSSAAHWRLGGFDGLEPMAGGLAVPALLTVSEIAIDPADRSALAVAVDRCGALLWLRSTGELLLAQQGYRLVLGFLPEKPTRGLIVGDDSIWLATANDLARYDRRLLQPLGEISAPGIITIAGDGGAGVWVLATSPDGPARWRRLDRYGSPVGEPIASPEAVVPVAAAGGCDGHELVLLDDHARVWALDTATGRWRLLVELSRLSRRFSPRLITVDWANRIHLIDEEQREYWTVSREGERIGRATLALPVPILGLAGGRQLMVAGPDGILTLSPLAKYATAQAGAAREARILTPTLVSPRGERQGWYRADIEADLPLGTTLVVRAAASDDEVLRQRVDTILADRTVSPAIRLRSAYGLLPFNDAPNAVLAGSDDPSGRGRFHVLLQDIPATYLWLALDLHVPPTSAGPTLRSLTVRYPSRSWLEDLPGIYSEDLAAAPSLRRYLAIFETVFDDLEERIETLPELFDPVVDKDGAWLDVALRRIGLTMPADLAPDYKRRLLDEAPVLMRDRGTLGALQSALTIVTAAKVRIVDLGRGPPPFVLGRWVDGGGARLGDGTLLTGGAVSEFRLGRAARLAATPLGRPLCDPAAQLAFRTNSVLIEIAAAPARQQDLMPTIEAILDRFLPATSRYRIAFVEARIERGRHLDDDAVLAGNGSAELGRTAVLGSAAIATRRGGLGIDTRFDNTSRLT